MQMGTPKLAFLRNSARIWIETIFDLLLLYQTFPIPIIPQKLFHIDYSGF